MLRRVGGGTVAAGRPRCLLNDVEPLPAAHLTIAITTVKHGASRLLGYPTEIRLDLTGHA